VMKLLIHSLKIPEEHLKALYPFKVRNNHTTGVTQNVRKNDRPIGHYDIYGFMGKRTVCSFSDNTSFHFMSIILRDDTIDGRRNENVHIQLEQFFIAEMFAIRHFTEQAFLLN